MTLHKVLLHLFYRHGNWRGSPPNMDLLLSSRERRAGEAFEQLLLRVLSCPWRLEPSSAPAVGRGPAELSAVRVVRALSSSP